MIAEVINRLQTSSSRPASKPDFNTSSANKTITKMTELVGKKIGPIGLGLMGLTWRNGPLPPQEQAFETMRAALKNGGMPLDYPPLSPLR